MREPKTPWHWFAGSNVPEVYIEEPSAPAREGQAFRCCEVSNITAAGDTRPKLPVTYQQTVAAST